MDADCQVTAHFAINVYALSYTVGANGDITGDANQSVEHGSDGTPVTAEPDEGHHFVQWSDGRDDNPRIDTAVTYSLSVQAQFAINTYTVMAGAGANGTLTPTGVQVVDHGDMVSFEVIPDTGYVAIIESSCGGDLVDTTFTTAPVTGDCSADASFVPPVRLQVIAGTGQEAPVGTAFATPLGVRIEDLAGDPVADVEVTFTAPPQGASTDPAQTKVSTDANGVARLNITANLEAGSYEVIASSAAYPAAPAVNFQLGNRLPVATGTASITDGRDYIRHGRIADYLIQVFNEGPIPSPAWRLIYCRVKPWTSLLPSGNAWFRQPAARRPVAAACRRPVCSSPPVPPRPTCSASRSVSAHPQPTPALIWRCALQASASTSRTAPYW